MKPLFIFEMANNHSGSVEHGLEIMKQVREKCIYPEFEYAFKFQYRNLDTFIHKDYKDRTDIKQIKRFSETKLSQEEFARLREGAKELGFLTICTPFDEISVDRVAEQGYDYMKIASCSFTDWSLLEKIGEKNLPVIASTAGATLEEIDAVVQFFRHRNKQLFLMHCVAEYPTKEENLQLNQIALLKNRYKDIRVGYSTHEDPRETVPVAIAIAKGATILEKHVGVATDTISLNGYSANPNQVERWLFDAHNAFLMCGIENGRPVSTEKECQDLRALRRGVFAKEEIEKGDYISYKNTYYALPDEENQLVINDMGKYDEVIATVAIKKDDPVHFAQVQITNRKKLIQSIYDEETQMLQKAGIALPPNAVIELSHHYGVDQFHRFGTAIIECINREYCKKILVELPGQYHPTHLHKKKEETFQVLYGDIEIKLGDEPERECHAGDILTVERGVQHSFRSENGGIFEEVSSTHFKDDSFYEDDAIMRNSKRKTRLAYGE